MRRVSSPDWHGLKRNWFFSVRSLYRRFSLKVEGLGLVQVKWRLLARSASIGSLVQRPCSRCGCGAGCMRVTKDSTRESFSPRVGRRWTAVIFALWRIVSAIRSDTT